MCSVRACVRACVCVCVSDTQCGGGGGWHIWLLCNVYIMKGTYCLGRKQMDSCIHYIHNACDACAL